MKQHETYGLVLIKYYLKLPDLVRYFKQLTNPNQSHQSVLRVIYYTQV